MTDVVVNVCRRDQEDLRRFVELGWIEIPRYPLGALEPLVSHETMVAHLFLHQVGYARTLADLVAPRLGRGVPEAVLADPAAPAAARAVAAQLVNHAFFWRSLRPHDGGIERLPDVLLASIGGPERLRRLVVECALSIVGSGWVWLVEEHDLRTGGWRLGVVPTEDAGTLLGARQDVMRPLAVVDVWEHAYYLDYLADRAAYVEAFCGHLLDWELVAMRWRP